MFIVSSILTPDHSLVVLKLRGHQNLLEVCENPEPRSPGLTPEFPLP